MANRKDTKGRVLKAGESQRKDGIYMYRYIDIRGKRQSVYAGDLKELRDKEKSIQKDLDSGIDYTAGNITVIALVKRYLRLKKGVSRQTLETVVLLSKLKVDHHIEIELKMDELDLTAAESKATYDEIKAYVLNKYGLKVSQLYIAQIKRKCGIIERKNYNVSKKEDAKVPQCPPEKEAAIMDALKHFQMI